MFNAGMWSEPRKYFRNGDGFSDVDPLIMIINYCCIYRKVKYHSRAPCFFWNAVKSHGNVSEVEMDVINLIQMEIF